MLARVINELGPWSWWLLGLVLLAAELMMPGVFLVWIGTAAIIVGALSLLLWDSAFWTWQVQLLLFAVLAVAVTLAGRKYLFKGAENSDQPLLNQRGAALIGRTAILEEPIREGWGRVLLDGTYWRVTGPDLPVGARIRIVATNGRDLTVEQG
ncbi:NfeD family protein [Rhizobiaceae bacterium n13]|uniref:NfeD family protein n=1 Tax=Ferirhizobium litorale TaxID=2927786 RepID=A0AAE3U0K3_9HYPH|nr:NfeD family protein [Fererhizobium litorale]MDI7860517.1 NfeD family protein [Fererhizobium litorale]MDI7920652.1 NfeD family protein [Fererhizobium litorale]